MDLTFRLADPARRLSGVRLVQEVGLRDVDLVWRAGAWSLTVTPPEVDRMEYLFEIDGHGRRQTITDPANPRLVDGAFGQKSVAVLPGYVEPAWLSRPTVEAEWTEIEVAGITGRLWSTGGGGPLLVVHDGPEFARLARLADYLGAFTADGTLPPLTAALLSPGDRNVNYAANDDYARSLGALVREVRSGATAVVGVGASLGALAMLHAHCRHPGTFDGLLLQSGSFFTEVLDPQESGFPGFGPVTSFVASVGGPPVRVAITCGTVEENLANNRRMAGVLGELGYRVAFATVRDAHNFTAWRDALHPHLTALVQDLTNAA